MITKAGLLLQPSACSLFVAKAGTESCSFVFTKHPWIENNF